MGLRGDIDVPALSSGSPWSHFAVQVVARSVANLRGSWLETFLALTHLGTFSRFFSGESYYLALLWGVEGRTRNSWFIQPTAIWGHDMVFSRSPFLPPRLRHAHPLGFASPQTRNAWLLLDFHFLSNMIWLVACLIRSSPFVPVANVVHPLAVTSRIAIARLVTFRLQGYVWSRLSVAS